MSDIFNPIKGLPIVQSLSLPSIDYYTGAYSAIRYVKATTDQGDIDLYNRTTLGLKVTPSCFDKAGDYDVILSYRDGVRPEVTSTAHITVQLEVPVKLEVLKAPRATSFREGEHPNLAGAKFKVTYNSGRVENLCEHEVIGSLSDGSLTYTYRSMGAEVTATSAIEVVKLSKIQASSSKTSYGAGESVKGIIVKGIYTDGSIENITDFDYEPKVVKAGDNYITITYKTFTDKIDIQVSTIIKSQEDLESKLTKDEKGNYILSGPIQLGTDVSTGDKRVNISDDNTVIDLNNHKLNTTFIAAYKDLEIKNGELHMSSSELGTLFVQEGVKNVTLENVKVISDMNAPTSSLVQVEEATLNIKDCELICTTEGASKTYLFSQWQDNGKAYIENVTTNTLIGTNGNIKNLYIEAKNCNTTAGVYISADGEYVFDGGNYTSNSQSAFEAKAGRITLKAGTFKSTAPRKHVPKNNGASTDGYDIAAVSNKSYAGGTITIEKGVKGKASELIDNATSKPMTIVDNRTNVAKSLTVSRDPDKNIYNTGDKFDSKGMTLKLTKVDNTFETLLITDTRISYKDPGTLNLSTPLIITYTDEYTILDCTYVIQVEDSTLEVSKPTAISDKSSTKISAGSAQVTLPAGTVEGGFAQVLVATKSTTDKVAIDSEYNSVDVIDINLSVDGDKVSEFNKPVEVSVTTLKGLDQADLRVYHNEEAIEVKSYNSNTGSLTFETTHFSMFVIGSTASVINLSTRTGYKDFKAAIDAVADNDVLRLYKDIVSSSNGFRIENGKKFIVDMGGCEIVAPSTPINLRHGNVEFTGKGTIRESEPDQFGAVYILGSFEEDIADYSVIKLGKDITLRGWSGIMIDGSNKNRPNYKGYGIVVESDATIKCPIDGDTVSAGTGIYVNGTNKLDIGDAPKLTIRGSITAGHAGTPSDAGCGIYAAGAGDWVLDNVDINSTSCAIEVRAGKMIVKGGTYSASTEDYKVSSNNSGTTTTGAAFAVSQHTTKLPIEVTINDAKLKGTVGLSVANPQKNSAIDCAKVSVIGKNVAYEATENTKISEDFALTGTDSTFEIKASANTSEA